MTQKENETAKAREAFHMRKFFAELIGTFWLVFGGCGSAVLAAKFPEVGYRSRWRCASLRLDRSHYGLCYRPYIRMPPKSCGYDRPHRRRTLPDRTGSSIYRRASLGRNLCGLHSFCHRKRGARLRSLPGLCRKRLWGSLAREVHAFLRLPVRGHPDHDVSVHHHGCDPWSVSSSR